jgi:hypothetical protein
LVHAAFVRKGIVIRFSVRWLRQSYKSAAEIQGERPQSAKQMRGLQPNALRGDDNPRKAELLQV